MVIIVSGAVWAGITVTKIVISKVLLWKAFERCNRPDENREHESNRDEEARDYGEDVPAQGVDNDEEEEQQPVDGSTIRTLGILKQVLCWVLNTGMIIPRFLRTIHRFWWVLQAPAPGWEPGVDTGGGPFEVLSPQPGTTRWTPGRAAVTRVVDT